VVIDVYPDLDCAFVEPLPGAIPISFRNYFLPSRFHANFDFKDGAKTWSATFLVSVNDQGEPKLLKVEVQGLVAPHPKPLEKTYTKDNPPKFKTINGVELIVNSFTKSELAEFSALQPERESVTRKQLKTIEQRRFDLLESALVMAVTTLTPKLAKDGSIKWDARPPVSPMELRELTKEIGTRIRRRLTISYLQKISAIYLKAIKENTDPITAIMESERIAHRTAVEHATRARRTKINGKPLLPPTTKGKVSTVTRAKDKK
jgi:hypothetical protein